MPKKCFMFILISLFIFSFAVSSFAQMKCMGHSGSSEHKHNPSGSMAQESQKRSVEVGNKICPVLNEKINERTKATYEYEGKIYNFCCEMCIDEFKKDPQKYIHKIEEELEAESQGRSKDEQRSEEMMQEPENISA